MNIRTQGRKPIAAGLTAMLVLAAAGLKWWNEPPEAADPPPREAGKPPEHAVPSKPPSEDRNRTTEPPPAALPLAAVKLLQIEAFEDDTGQLTRKFSDAFGMSREERKAVQTLLSPYLESFAAVELSKAEIVQENGEGFIRLNPCHEEIAAISESMRKSLSEVLGIQRGDAAFALLEKQLRDGGRNRLEISFTAIEDGSQWVLVRDLFDATGSRISHLEGPRLLNAEYASLARWRHLSQLFEHVTE